MLRILRASAACLVVLFLLVPSASYAALLPTPTGSCPKDPNNPAENLQCNTVTGICGNTKIPCNYSVQDIQDSIVSVGNWIIGIIGLVVLVLFMYGGFLWLIAAGNSQKIDQGLSIMVGAGIGLLIVFSAGAVMRYFLLELKVSPEIVNKIPIGDSTTSGGVDTGGSTPKTKKTVCGCTYGSIPADKQLGSTFELAAPGIVNAANCKTFVQEDLSNKLQAEALGPVDPATIDSLMAGVSCSPKEI